ncbi:hypothetical protein BDN70DRAFT_439542 [Pholiota conissans]|uniref:Uncharacterized protein n=1 Tax=Pholiota conissans TaxID=109636 RepID=A0A9P6CUN6_9AGAR|nr:hypothetical protein BDN70DRAFT_439542 [Pholiota conissans]
MALVHIPTTRIQMFARSRNTLITGGEFQVVNITEHRGSTAFKELQMASAPGATHDSSTRFDPPKCHPSDVRRDSEAMWVLHRRS